MKIQTLRDGDVGNQSVRMPASQPTATGSASTSSK